MKQGLRDLKNDQIRKTVGNSKEFFQTETMNMNVSYLEKVARQVSIIQEYWMAYSSNDKNYDMSFIITSLINNLKFLLCLTRKKISRVPDSDIIIDRINKLYKNRNSHIIPNTTSFYPKKLIELEEEFIDCFEEMIGIIDKAGMLTFKAMNPKYAMADFGE